MDAGAATRYGIVCETRNRTVNRYQLTVLVAAFANLALLLLFPPFDNRPSQGMGPASFDSFCPMFAAPENGIVNTGLLYLETLPVLVNAAIAWLLLEGRQRRSLPSIRWQTVLQGLVAIDVLLMVLFPPYETRPIALGFGDRTFEGFNFVLSGGPQRGIFVPLLYMELSLLAVNTAALWVAFWRVARGYEAEFVDAEREKGALGRSAKDRRQHQDPNYSGPERRSGTDRRALR